MWFRARSHKRDRDHTTYMVLDVTWNGLRSLLVGSHNVVVTALGSCVKWPPERRRGEPREREHENLRRFVDLVLQGSSQESPSRTPSPTTMTSSSSLIIDSSKTLTTNTATCTDLHLNFLGLQPHMRISSGDCSFSVWILHTFPEYCLPPKPFRFGCTTNECKWLQVADLVAEVGYHMRSWWWWECGRGEKFVGVWVKVRVTFLG